MCTAITYKAKDLYFGRNLDHMESYGEEVVITPRKFPFRFRQSGEMKEHFAIIGTACMMNGFPMYYDGVNEKGLCMAGLNFVGNAFYTESKKEKDNIAQFEMIPWILGDCADLDEAGKKLDSLNIADISFDEKTPPAQLHWIIADRSGAMVVEATRQGLNIYDDPAGVLTNNPPFPIQMSGLIKYMGLSAKDPENRFSPQLSLNPISRGMGAFGLPGDLSSESRFVRAAFNLANASAADSEEECVSQFFHILGQVEFTKGCCDLGDSRYDVTIYTGCCNADKGIYYYTTYNNRSISAVHLWEEDVDGSMPACFPMMDKQQINHINLK